MREEIKTLQQCKDEVARKYFQSSNRAYVSWADMENIFLTEQRNTIDLMTRLDEAAELYASQFNPSAPETGDVKAFDLIEAWDKFYREQTPEQKQAIVKEMNELIPAPTPVDVEKPDFESLAIELINEKCSVVDHGHDCACGHVQDAMEKIWNDHVLPFHSLIKSKDQTIKKYSDKTLEFSERCVQLAYDYSNAESEIWQQKARIKEQEEEIAQLKEALKDGIAIVKKCDKTFGKIKLIADTVNNTGLVEISESLYEGLDLAQAQIRDFIDSTVTPTP